MVDEQDIPIATHGLEGAGVGRVKLNGTLTRATRDGHDWIVLGIEVERRDDGNANLDFWRAGVVRILRPKQGAAARLDARVAGSGADTTVFKRKCLRIAYAACKQQSQANQRDTDGSSGKTEHEIPGDQTNGLSWTNPY